ncbi:MAG: Gldg family protein [Pseudomonadales bacterium]|nr:Gldg family protein [Pseudomonadales bacterium]
MFSAGFKRILWSTVGLPILVLVLLVGVLLIAQIKNFRLDLTDEGLYTLSEGTKNIIKSIDENEKLELTLFFSEKLSRKSPPLTNYHERVKELLDEYELNSNGRILVKYVDPEPFSEAEDFAAQFGLQGIPFGEGETIYFGLVGVNSSDQVENIAFFNPDHQSFLEYEISQLIFRLSAHKKPVLGVITGLPQIFPHMDVRVQKKLDPVVVMEQLRKQYEIRRVIDNEVDEIEPSIDVLMVVHPHMLSEKTLFAIDQFVLSGKPLIAFMDPDAEMDTYQMPLDNGFVDRSSSLEQLLEQWGVIYSPSKVLLNYGFAHEIPVTQFGRPLPHLGVFGIPAESMDASEVITAGLEEVNFSSAGAMLVSPSATTEVTPLLTSGKQTQLIDVDRYTMVSSHADLLRDFKSEDKEYLLAAMVRGKVKTAFPDGKPLIAETGSPDDADHSQAASGEQRAWLREGEIRVILVSDTDVLADRMWVQVQSVYGKNVATPWASNGDFIENMVDKMAGSPDLISLRTRGVYQKPFERVDELQKKAVDRFREQERLLDAKLKETEEKLSQLTGDSNGIDALTEAQQQQVRKFQIERLEIRKNLREVQHQLNADIEKLATVLKLINTIGVPLLMTVLLLLFVLFRRSRVTPPR